jgi:hypothetical protein
MEDLLLSSQIVLDENLPLKFQFRMSVRISGVVFGSQSRVVTWKPIFSKLLLTDPVPENKSRAVGLGPNDCDSILEFEDDIAFPVPFWALVWDLGFKELFEIWESDFRELTAWIWFRDLGA